MQINNLLFVIHGLVKVVVGKIIYEVKIFVGENL